MKLEMTTKFLHLIEPGMYGTNLGDAMDNLDENYFDDFRNAIVEYGIEKINEMLFEDSIRENDVEGFEKFMLDNNELFKRELYSLNPTAWERIYGGWKRLEGY